MSNRLRERSSASRSTAGSSSSSSSAYKSSYTSSTSSTSSRTTGGTSSSSYSSASRSTASSSYTSSSRLAPTTGSSSSSTASRYSPSVPSRHDRLAPPSTAERGRRSSTDRERLNKTAETYKSSSSTSDRGGYSSSSTPASSAAMARLEAKNVKGPESFYKPIFPVATVSPAAKATPTISRTAQQEEYTAVVIDHGSRNLKAGVGGEYVPRYVFPSLMGRPRHPGLMAGMTKKDTYVGDEAQQKRDVLSLSWPMDSGLITNFDDAQKIWLHTYKELEIPPEDQPLVWSEAALVRQEQRELVGEYFFETLAVPAICFASQSVLSVYAAGLSSALVVDLGEKCDVMVVIEGGALSHVDVPSIRRLKTTGSDVTEHLEQILAERGYYFTTPAEREIVETLKEKSCYVAENPNDEITQEITLMLPDGQPITIGNERFRAAEVLFVPMLMGKEGLGLHALILQSIMEAPIDNRVELARTILLSGGTSMLPGLAPRIEKEVTALAPTSKLEISVIPPNDRKYSAWIGGATLASSDNFEQFCVTKNMWDEAGKTAVQFFYF